jgi:catecholate siderophore receptor
MPRSVCLLAVSACLASPAFAAEATDDQAQAAVAAAAAEAAAEAAADEAEPPIVVTGERPEYGIRSTRSATRTDTEVKDIPQSLTVISESQIEDQALRSIADVLTFVPGATPGTGEGNRDQITLRGNNTTADFFVDGIRDDVQYFRDLYNAQRIEILRGPNAMIFGRGGGGGVVNRVTKRASADPYRELAAQGDSEGGFRLTGDVNLPLGGEAGLRVNGVYEDGESFRRFVELERYGINPTVGTTLGGTRIDLAYEYFCDRRTADRGIPADGPRPLRGADRIFFGDPRASFADVDAHIATLGIEHDFGGGLSLRNRTSYGDFDKFYQNVYPTDLNETTRRVRLAAYNDVLKRENLFSQTDLVWKNRLGGIDQTWLVGFELGRQETQARRRNGFFQLGGGKESSSLDVPLASPTVDAALVYKPTNFNDSDANVLAFYAQDQLRLGDSVELVLGLRYDRFEIDVHNLISNRDFSRVDNLLSPRAGLIVKPTDRLSLYASYGRSYLPSAGDQFTSLDVTSEALKPERFDNYELGAKWDPVAGLLATVAVYRLDRTNTRAADPLNPARTLLTGAQRSRGLEIGLERNVTDRWQISAGYALQEAEVRRATTACPKSGCEVPLVPRHQFSMWNRYNFSKTLGFGLGIVARSKMFSSLGNQVTLPAYARVDAAVFYEVADGIEAQLNVENLLGADYFATAHNDNNIAPGAPATARATLRFRF